MPEPITLQLPSGSLVTTNGDGQFYSAIGKGEGVSTNGYNFDGQLIEPGSTVYLDAQNSYRAYQKAVSAGVQNPTFNDYRQYITGATYPNPQTATPATAGGATASPSGGTATSYPSGAPASSPYASGYTQTPISSAEFDAWLKQQNLSPDESSALQAIYSAVASNDAEAASRLSSAMAAATQYSDPYFRAKVRMVTDALSRGLSSKDGDLAFQATQLQNTLDDLKKQTASSKDMLTFQQQQELSQLEQKYTQELDTTQNDLAARGFTSSSNRAQAEKLLGDNYSAMQEGTNKEYSFKNMQIDNTLSQTTRDTQSQIDNLTRLASEGKLDALRQAEQQVGTDTLNQLGYTNTLGGVGGEIPRAQIQDALSFANGFVL